MKLYEVSHGDPSLDVNGHRQMSLPILWCSVHGRRITFETNYPCFDPSVFPAKLRGILKGYATNYEPVNIAALRELIDLVAKYCPDGMFLGPSVGFGPYHVEEEFGKPGDFSPIGLFSFGGTAAAIERMGAKKVILPPSRKVETKSKHFRSHGLLEFEIHPRILAAPSMGFDTLDKCPECGEFLEDERLKVPDEVVIAKKSVPKGENLYRWKEYDNIFFASNRFVDAYHDLGMKGISFKEVDLE